MPTETHIVPLMVGDAESCKARATCCWTEHGIYIQPINYPTVPRGTERLRITPTPFHDEALIAQLAERWSKPGSRSACRSRTGALKRATAARRYSQRRRIAAGRPEQPPAA